jgi:hypothetical protein
MEPHPTACQKTGKGLCPSIILLKTFIGIMHYIFNILKFSSSTFRLYFGVGICNLSGEVETLTSCM